MLPFEHILFTFNQECQFGSLELIKHNKYDAPISGLSLWLRACHASWAPSQSSSGSEWLL